MQDIAWLCIQYAFYMHNAESKFHMRLTPKKFKGHVEQI